MARKASAVAVPRYYRVEDVAFDPVTHTSTLPDGRSVPHVTAVLEATGLSTDFEELSAGSHFMRDRIAYACARGTAVHMDCHAYDDDDLDWATVDSGVRPYVDAWVTCRDALGLVAVAHARERRLFHPVYFYTGILDGVFLRGPKRVLVDIKTGDPESAAAHLQTAAYESAWNFLHPDHPIDERCAIWLQPRRAIPYSIVDYSNATQRPHAWQDFQKWAAALCVYNEQPGRRSRA